MPGPCDPEDLLDGVVFGAKYLGSTQLKSEKNPSTNARMAQAQEAVERIKVKSDKTCKVRRLNSAPVWSFRLKYQFSVFCHDMGWLRCRDQDRNTCDISVIVSVRLQRASLSR